MIDIVIIGHNEGEYIEKMYHSLKPYPYQRHWILDRCTDNSEQLLSSLGEEYTKTDSNLKGRQTSYCRNLGLSLCNKDADVLFLDGDRYVESGNITDLENTDYDINLLYLTEDLRDGIIDITKTYGQVYNFFFSCGIFFKRSALNKILDFQNNELFSEDIQEHWGIEDTYLGDVCYHLKLTCNYNKGIRLHGKFEKTAAEIDTIYVRLQKRDKLNVLWN